VRKRKASSTAQPMHEQPCGEHAPSMWLGWLMATHFDVRCGSRPWRRRSGAPLGSLEPGARPHRGGGGGGGGCTRALAACCVAEKATHTHTHTHTQKKDAESQRDAAQAGSWNHMDMNQVLRTTWTSSASESLSESPRRGGAGGGGGRRRRRWPPTHSPEGRLCARSHKKRRRVPARAQVPGREQQAGQLCTMSSAFNRASCSFFLVRGWGLRAEGGGESHCGTCRPRPLRQPNGALRSPEGAALRHRVGGESL
jgi:hypothetical protein